jgi:hypothetical protein
VIQASQDFPWVAAGVSIIALLIGGWLFFRRPRKRRGNEPHCGKCDYPLSGISSERCPECGTVIDAKSLSYGQRRGQLIRRVIGTVVVMIGVGVSWTPVQRWAGSVYWYQYRPTFLVMRDLKNGSGLPCPMNDPLDVPMSTHGWLSEEVDLARCALDELLRREKRGALSPTYRHEIDELALAKLTVKETTPVECYLRQQLVDRAVEGKLTAEEQANFYQRVVSVELSARQRVVQGNIVPIRFRYKSAGYDATSRAFVSTIRRLEIDGTDTAQKLEEQEICGDWDVNCDQAISCLELGKHTLNVELQIDFREDGPDGKTIHSEIRHLTTSFQVLPNAPETAIALLNDPPADKLRACISVPELGFYVHEKEFGGLLGQLKISPVPVGVAFDVYARVDGHEWELGHGAGAAGDAEAFIGLQSEGREAPMPIKVPDSIDIILRSSTRVAAGTLDLYSVWNGELVLKKVPFIDHSSEPGY